MSDTPNMVRDERDVWPDDVPIGSFDIHQRPTEGYPGTTAHIEFKCPNGRHCNVLLAPQPIARSSKDRLHVWGWDGNVEQPTITPSINCLVEEDGKPVGGCGWHGFITKGVMR